MTLAVDHYSGIVLGYYLTFAPPSAASVLAALRHAILPKTQANFGDGHVNSAGGDSKPPREYFASTWNAYGIPDLLVVDNGLDLTSHGVLEACDALGTDILFTPPRSPWYKGTIERFGRTINTRFIHWLFGTTLGKAATELQYNGAEHATLIFEDFDSLLLQYITTIHNKIPRRGKNGTPERLFLSGCELWPVRVPLSMTEFDAAVALTRTGVLRQTGLHFLDLQYQNSLLGELFNRTPASTRLNFKVNPLDLRIIQVWHPVLNKFFPVSCVNEYEWPRTLSFHTTVRAFARENGIGPNDRRGIARAERDLLSAIERAALTSRRVLRRMQAEILRQGEDLGEEARVSTSDSAIPDDPIGDVFDEVYSK